MISKKQGKRIVAQIKIIFLLGLWLTFLMRKIDGKG